MSRTTARLAAGVMSTAAVLAAAGFTALGAIFDYPQILQEPTAETLERYRAHAAAVSGWFLVLVLSAALLAPAGILLGRLIGGRPAGSGLGRWTAAVGVAAATVQVIGLSRWVLFVPGLAADGGSDARHTFEVLHRWLGVILGETVGYALTATFTILVVLGLGRPDLVGRDGGPGLWAMPRWLQWVGLLAAGLVATGVLIPLGVEIAELTNFVGYVLWCVWLISLSVVLWRHAAAMAEPAR